jgi:Asp-tRNA(Asn)/Glu-tRNA(Gln) amidotransferase A subunit family amidase
MPPARPFVEELGAELGQLRVAFSTQPLSGVPVDPDCIAAVEDAVKLVEGFGCRVEESMPSVSAEGFLDAFKVIAGGNTMSAIEQYAALTGREISPNEFENISWQFAKIGENATATAYATSIKKIHQLGREVARFFVDYDLFITPTVAKPSLLLGVLDMMSNDPDEYAENLFGFAAFTSLFNASGNPAMSVPLHWSAEGLPVGVHFVGRYGEESTLFRVAAKLEQAKPWADRKPPVCA